METVTERVNMSEIGTTTATTNSTGVAMVRQMIEVGPMVHLKTKRLPLGKVEVVWQQLRLCCEIW